MHSVRQASVLRERQTHSARRARTSVLRERQTVSARQARDPQMQDSVPQTVLRRSDRRQYPMNRIMAPGMSRSPRFGKSLPYRRERTAGRRKILSMTTSLNSSFWIGRMTRNKTEIRRSPWYEENL